MEKEMVKEKEFCIIIVFEGDFLNGEKNGKGKEYNWF